nr:MAG TPA: hypothetical protein [Caudoviricetes sp.]
MNGYFDADIGQPLSGRTGCGNRNSRRLVLQPPPVEGPQRWRY